MSSRFPAAGLRNPFAAVRRGHRITMMSRAWRMLAAASLLALAMATAATVGAQAAPSPSPTLGSTNSPAPNPPGSADSTPQDYNGAVWVVVAVVAVAAVVGLGTLFLARSRRMDLEPRSPRNERRRATGDRAYRRD
ncbi:MULTISPECIES: hypothetical protein [Kribbella]